MTDGQVLSLIIALSKNQVLKYGSIGITNVYSNSSGDGIVFELANGTKNEIKFSSLNFMKLSDFDKNNDGVIDLVDISNFAKESENARNALKLNNKEANLYFQKDIDNTDNIAEGTNNKFLKSSDKEKIDKIPSNLDIQLNDMSNQIGVNKSDIDDLKIDNTKNKNDISQLQSDVLNKKDELVKLNTTDTAGYLGNKIDNTTIVIQGDKLIAKTLDGLTVTLAELNMLQGAKSNIQSQINSITKGMEYKGQVNTYADLSSLSNPQSGWTVIVKVDENHSNKKMFYIYDGVKWEATYEVSATSMGRDFLTDGIDLSTETKGILPKEKISIEIARQVDVDKKIEKVTSATQDNIAILNSDGTLKDSGKKLSNYSETTHTHKDLEDKINLKVDKTELHNHVNKDILDKFTDNGTGLKYNDKEIGSKQILEFTTKTDFPSVGEENKIYVDKSKNIQYRWNTITNSYVAYNSGSSGTGTGSAITVIDNTSNINKEITTELNKLTVEGNANVSSYIDGEVKVTINGLSVENDSGIVTNNANTLVFEGMNITEQNHKIVIKNTGGENVGEGVQIFKPSYSNNKSQFKTLKAGINTNIIDTSNEIIIESTLSNERTKNIIFDNMDNFEISNKSPIETTNGLKFKAIKDNPSALLLDGLNYADVNMSSWGSNYTLECKIKPSTNVQNAWAGILFRGNSSTAEGLFIDSTRLYFRNGTTYSPLIEQFTNENYPTNEFTHISIVQSGNKMTYYKIKEDGTFIKVIEFVFSPRNSTDKFSIGRFGTYVANDSQFKGIIDDVRIWNKDLTEDEIKKNWNKKLIGNEDKLMAYWNCDEGTGSILKDSTSNKYNASFNNPKWTNDTSFVGNTYKTEEVLIKTIAPNTNIDLNLVKQIQKVNIQEIKYLNSEIKYMISFDGGKIWKYHNGHEFVISDISDIKTIGNNKEGVIQGLSNYIVKETDSQLLFAISFINNSTTTTPILNNISIDYILGTIEMGKIGSKYVDETLINDNVVPIYNLDKNMYELKTINIDINTLPTF